MLYRHHATAGRISAIWVAAARSCGGHAGLLLQDVPGEPGKPASHRRWERLHRPHRRSLSPGPSGGAPGERQDGVVPGGPESTGRRWRRPRHARFPRLTIRFCRVPAASRLSVLCETASPTCPGNRRRLRQHRVANRSRQRRCGNSRVGLRQLVFEDLRSAAPGRRNWPLTSAPRRALALSARPETQRAPVSTAAACRSRPTRSAIALHETGCTWPLRGCRIASAAADAVGVIRT